MSDLVERLREYSLSPTVQAEAADEIERLLARCKELEAAFAELDAVSEAIGTNATHCYGNQRISRILSGQMSFGSLADLKGLARLGRCFCYIQEVTERQTRWLRLTGC